MKFTEVLTEAYLTPLKESNGKINQTDRNALRNELLHALASDLDATMTSEGAVVSFAHEYWGELCVEITLKMKDPNFDLPTAEQEYVDKLNEQEDKKLESAKRAAERLAKSEATKRAKATKGTKQVLFCWAGGLGGGI